MKKCTKCKSILPESEFHRRLNGLRPQCKYCRSEEEKNRYANNMEQFYEKHKQWFVDYPKVVQKDKFSDDLVKMFDKWRQGNE